MKYIYILLLLFACTKKDPQPAMSLSNNVSEDLVLTFQTSLDSTWKQYQHNGTQGGNHFFNGEKVETLKVNTGDEVLVWIHRSGGQATATMSLKAEYGGKVLYETSLNKKNIDDAPYGMGQRIYTRILIP